MRSITVSTTSSRTATRSSLDFSNGTTFEAPDLIGADGGASAVRNAVFGGQDASYTGHVALRALVPFARVPQAIIADPYALYVGAGRSLIHYPLRRQATMNVLGNAQAPQWQAEGWSFRAPWRSSSACSRISRNPCESSSP